ASSLARQAGAQEESARAGFTRAQADLVLLVKQAFYGYAQQQRQVAVQEANLRNRRAHLAQARARVQAGIGLPIDVVRAETAVAEAVLGLNLAQTNAAVARVTLAQLLGLDPRTPLEIAEDAEPAPTTDDFAALQAQALARRPELSQAQATLRAADYAARAAHAANSPRVMGTVGMGLRGPSFPPSNETLTLGVALEWAAFDGGNLAGRLDEARAQQVAAQAQVATATLAVAASVSQAYLNATTAEQRILTADAQVANAGEAVRLAEGRYAAGLGTFLDVLDAQAALVTAQTNSINARSAVNQARAALAHAIHADPALAPDAP
ncbi:MAG TPA: TolC family protein, partial [Armatimonadota bacterium]|nr:TolC family protein [Armatimonadota bacterium]